MGIQFKNLSLQKKLTLIILFISGMALLLACFAFIVYDRITFKNSIVRELTIQTQILGRNSASAVLFNDPQSADETLNALNANNRIVIAGIFTQDGTLLATYARNPAVGPETFPKVKKPGNYFTNRTVQVFEEMSLNGQKVGTAFVESDLSALNERFQRFMVIVGIVGLFAFVMILILTSLLQKLIARPVLHLAEIATRVSQEKNYALRAQKYGRDEVGHLIDSFNDMLKKIQDRERALAESELRYRSVTESAKEAIIATNDVGYIVSWNKGAGDIFQYEESEITGKHVTILFSSDDRDRYRLEMALFRENKKSSPFGGKSAEFTGIKKDGTVFPLEVSVSAWKTGEGQFFTGIMRDITERKTMESQLIQSQKLESIGQLAAGVAHEINTPAQYVGDNIHFISESFKEIVPLLNAAQTIIPAVPNNGPKIDIDFLTQEIPKAIDQSLEGIDRISTIIRALKDFSHPGHESKKAVDLNKAIESTITVARNEWKYVADVTTDFDKNLPPVLCLPGEMNQVFLNIIVNAAHAIRECNEKTKSQEKGKIHIQTRKVDTWVEIRISDSGLGIPKEIQGRIFDPFFTTKEVGTGTGQGLAISRSIVVDKHGGNITFETEAHKGTTFIIRLPLEATTNKEEKTS